MTEIMRHTHPCMANKRAARTRERRGYLYVAVLFSSLLVATAVAGALALSTAQLRRSNGRADRLSVIQLAESELHLQAARMQASTAWRSSLGNGDFSAWRDLLGGRVRHSFTDLDGNLGDDSFDQVTLTIHAQLDATEAAISAELVNRTSPMSLLRYNATALEDLRIDNSAHVATEAPVQAGDDCRTNDSGVLVTPKLEYDDVLTATVRGDTGSSAPVGPTADAFDRYEAIGTKIPRGVFPKLGSDRLMENVVLSSTHNPYGTADPNGIYIIDAGNRALVLRNCRIEGTLVVRRGTGVRVRGGMLWNSLDPERTALLSEASLTFELLTPGLSEATQATNFNPPHTPARGGESNETLANVYPTSIAGVVYSLGDIRIDPLADNARLHVAGALIANNIVVTARLSLTHVPELVANPPLGFRDPAPMQFVRGSLRRVPTP